MKTVMHLTSGGTKTALPMPLLARGRTSNISRRIRLTETSAIGSGGNSGGRGKKLSARHITVDKLMGEGSFGQVFSVSMQRSGNFEGNGKQER